MDPYLSDIKCTERLYDDYVKHKSLIVAFDFDNTVYDYHQKGESFNNLISLLRECRRMGFYLICFTSCNDDRLPEIEKYLNENDIPYHSINGDVENIPFKGRKVYYNILLDDRAGLASAYNVLTSTISWIKGNQHSEEVIRTGEIA
jgi:hypothetical protein